MWLSTGEQMIAGLSFKLLEFIIDTAWEGTAII